MNKLFVFYMCVYFWARVDALLYIDMSIHRLIDTLCTYVK